jgi:hypothetical protein
MLMLPRRFFELAFLFALCTLPLYAQNIAVRGSLALSGCTAVDAADGIAYVAHQGTLSVISVNDPDHPTLLGSVTSGAATVNGLAVSGHYAYLAGQSNGLIIINVTDPTTPVVTRQFSLGTASALDLAVRDTLIAVGTNTYVALIGVRNPAQPHILATYGHSATWVALESESLHVHVGSTTGVLSLRIQRYVNAGDTTFAFAQLHQYGSGSMGPLDVVGPYLDAARSSSLVALDAQDYTLAGERQTNAVVRGVAGIHNGTTDKVFIAMADGTVEYLRHQASTGNPQFVAGATLPAGATGLALTQFGAQAMAVATQTNGITVLVYDAAPVSPEPVVQIPDKIILSAYPNPFNSVVELRMTVPRPGMYHWAVYDILGREIHSESSQLSGTVLRRLDFAGYPSGNYFVRLNGAAGATIAKLLYLP